MGVGLRPGAKASEAPPMPYRPRASPRLYTNLVGTLLRPSRKPCPTGLSPPGGSNRAAAGCDVRRRPVRDGR